jgi:hypothetical protein
MLGSCTSMESRTMRTIVVMHSREHLVVLLDMGVGRADTPIARPKAAVAVARSFIVVVNKMIFQSVFTRSRKFVQRPKLRSNIQSTTV